MSLFFKKLFYFTLFVGKTKPISWGDVINLINGLIRIAVANLIIIPPFFNAWLTSFKKLDCVFEWNGYFPEIQMGLNLDRKNGNQRVHKKY